MKSLVNGMLSFAPVRFPDGKIDIDASTQVARRVAEEFAKEDDSLTVKLGEAAVQMLEEAKYQNLKHISTAALGRMALMSLGFVPDDKSCKDAALRLRVVLGDMSDKFLVIKAGKNSGVYYKPRYTEAELNLINTGK